MYDLRKHVDHRDKWGINMVETWKGGMYIPRSIEAQMLEWKENGEGLVLEIKGARQVGKTTAILHFCEKNYKNVIYVNLLNESGEVFLDVKQDYRMQRPIPPFYWHFQEYAKRYGKEFSNDKDTVIVIDEIQASESVYTMIRDFHRELKCDVIVTGSYLHRAEKFFQPAGDITVLTMYTISFPEFIHLKKKCYIYDHWSGSVLSDHDLRFLQTAFWEYCSVGGYPAAVVSYLKYGERGLDSIFGRIMDVLLAELRAGMNALRDTQVILRILKSVIMLSVREKMGDSRLIKHVRDAASGLMDISIPKVVTDTTALRVSEEECYNAIAWLEHAGLLSYCGKTDLVTGASFADERMFFNDLGLLTYLCSSYQIKSSDAKGLVCEAFVFRSLRERDVQEEFYDCVFGAEGITFATFRGNEIDFYLKSRDGAKYGIDAKGGKSGSVSCRKALDEKMIDYVVLFKGNANYGEADCVVTVPLPLAYKFKYTKAGPIQQRRALARDFG